MRACLRPCLPACLLACRDGQELLPSELDPKVVEVYQGVGKVLSRYTSGKVRGIQGTCAHGLTGRPARDAHARFALPVHADVQDRARLLHCMPGRRPPCRLMTSSFLFVVENRMQSMWILLLIVTTTEAAPARATCTCILPCMPHSVHHLQHCLPLWALPGIAPRWHVLPGPAVTLHYTRWPLPTQALRRMRPAPTRPRRPPRRCPRLSRSSPTCRIGRRFCT